MAGLFRRASADNIPDYEDFLRKDKPRFNEFYNKRLTYNVTLNDFNRLTTLGAGAFGRVMLVKNKNTDDYYALKILDKRKIVSSQQIAHTTNEKRILQAINFPFMVHLDFCFTDNSYIYFVLPFIMGGEMFNQLRKMKKFDEDLARFYGAQVCLGLDYLHYLDLVYRDLKPENLLIDETGYVKITDFGFCKLISGRTYTLCGTPEYLAPELILSRGYGMAVDWWSFGILLFEMNAGFTPFACKDTMLMYEKIVGGKYKVPPNFSVFLRDLLRNLIQLDLSKRFGNLKGGVNDIKDHTWFKNMNWDGLLNRRLKPPYKPIIKDVRDACKHFDRLQDEPLRISETDHFVKEFKNF